MRLNTIYCIVIGTLLAEIAFAQAPVVFFTDLTSGPNTGGQNNNGTILTVYGKNFGATQGSSTVTVGGGTVAAYLVWGGHNKAVTTLAQLETISVAIGSSAATGTVVVTTPQGASTCANTLENCQFTVRSGNIYNVATTGSNGASGAWTTPWQTIPYAAHTAGAGSIVYVQNGVNASSVDNYNAAVNVQVTGTSTNPIAFVVYPGATATIGTSSTSRGVYIGYSGGSYTTWKGFTVVASEEGYEHLGTTYTRIVDNDVSCPNGNGQDACNHAESAATYVFYYGNYLHDTGTACSTDCKEYHDVYMSTNTQHVWIGWNEIAPQPAQTTPATLNGGCRAVQFYSTGGVDQGDLHVHDNWIHDSVCDAINFSTVNTDTAGGVEAYNNVIWHVGTGPTPTTSDSNYTAMNTGWIASHTNPVLFYNNSIYDAGSRLLLGANGDSGAFSCNTPCQLKNNIIQLVSGEQYRTNTMISCCASDLSGSNNVWYGASSTPTQTTGNITTNPLYSSTSSPFDLRLQSTSPAINAGVTISGLIYDITGLTRPQGSSYDIGAYEFFNSGGSLLFNSLFSNSVVR